MKSILQKSNPLKKIGCGNPDCLPCKQGRGEGGDCESCSVNYELECQLCPQDNKSVYIGESARNLYTRSKEHLNTFVYSPATSFIAKHQSAAHSGEEPSYKAKVTACTRDCLTRQVREVVLMRRSQSIFLNMSCLIDTLTHSLPCYIKQDPHQTSYHAVKSTPNTTLHTIIYQSG